MIVVELIQIQKQRGLSNSQFAESLGIHRISWYRNKRTKILSAEVLLRAFEVYPELRESFLSSFTDTDHSLTHHNEPETPFRAWIVSLLKRLNFKQ